MRQTSAARRKANETYRNERHAYVLFRHHRWDTPRQVCVSVDGNHANGVCLPTSELKLHEGRWTDRVVLVGVPRWLMHQRKIAWKRFDLPAVRSYHNKDLRTLTHEERMQMWDDERWQRLKEAADFRNGVRRTYDPTSYDRKFSWRNA